MRAWIVRFLARTRSLIRGMTRRSELERDMREEFRAHIALRTDDLVRQGVSRHEAAHRAHLEFGHEEAHRESARRARGLAWLDHLRFSWIDVRLGLRMLVKHPGLTVVAAFALAVGIPVGMAPSHLADALERPLPEDPENRVRAIRFWDPAMARSVSPSTADLERWSAELSSASAVGGYRTFSVQIDAEGRAAAVPAAVVTASVFEILRRPALLGRTLGAADEAPGA
ncbi:MAG: permease prefix domain 1-containing protein, partial [Longimicrobiales bacterium]